MVRPVWPVALLVACSSGLSVAPPGKDTTSPDAGAHTAEDTTETEHTGAGPNEPPTADAGPDQSGLVTDRFDLDGSGSDDPDGDTLSWEWTFTSTPVDSSAELVDGDRPDPSFVADRPGTYLLELAVDDGEFVSTDSVVILVTAPNAGPVANAGLDVTVDLGDLVVLNGSSSYDPEGDSLSYDWTLGSPPGSSAVLVSPRTALPSFTADVAGTFVASLVVSDGTESSPVDQVRVTVREPSSGDCLSCETAATELRRRADGGQLAGAVLLFAVPVLTARWQKRRR
jgi:hypothetical protein